MRSCGFHKYFGVWREFLQKAIKLSSFRFIGIFFGLGFSSEVKSQHPGYLQRHFELSLIFTHKAFLGGISRPLLTVKEFTE